MKPESVVIVELLGARSTISVVRFSGLMPVVTYRPLIGIFNAKNSKESIE